MGPLQPEPRAELGLVQVETPATASCPATRDRDPFRQPLWLTRLCPCETRLAMLFPWTIQVVSIDLERRMAEMIAKDIDLRWRHQTAMVLGEFWAGFDREMVDGGEACEGGLRDSSRGESCEMGNLSVEGRQVRNLFVFKLLPFSAVSIQSKWGCFSSFLFSVAFKVSSVVMDIPEELSVAAPCLPGSQDPWPNSFWVADSRHPDWAPEMMS